VRTILHIDMDAFFASVEQRDDPALRGRPVLVGANSPRGVVAAASYEARAFGVRSAMPMVQALRRCPKAIVIRPRMDRYREASAEVFAVFRRFTPLVEGLSLDEAFLDVSGSRALFGDGPAIARAIKAQIRERTGLVASAGVAPNKFVAKIASAMDKPDGLVVVAPEGVEAFLRPLPVERMWGVGPKAAARLRAVGFVTLGDLAAASPDTLRAILGAGATALPALARGQDERPVVPERDAKSVGGEETFPRDLHRIEELEAHLLRQSARVAARLTRAHLRGRCVTVKLKYGNHRTRTRARTLDEAVGDTDSIYDVARELLRRFDGLDRGVRLIGVSVSELRPAGGPASLFPDEEKLRRERLEVLALTLRDRFGARAVTRARLLSTEDGESGFGAAALPPEDEVEL